MLLYSIIIDQGVLTIKPSAPQITSGSGIGSMNTDLTPETIAMAEPAAVLTLVIIKERMVCPRAKTPDRMRYVINTISDICLRLV